MLGLELPGVSIHAQLSDQILEGNDLPLGAAGIACHLDQILLTNGEAGLQFDDLVAQFEEEQVGGGQLASRRHQGR